MLKSTLMRSKPVSVRSVCSFTPNNAVRVTPRLSVRQQISRVSGKKNVMVMASSEQAVEEQVRREYSACLASSRSPVLMSQPQAAHSYDCRSIDRWFDPTTTLTHQCAHNQHGGGG